MYTRLNGLGLIPAWQFDMTAANPKINPHVQFPEGVTQSTIQPLGPYYGNNDGLHGLGLFDSWAWNNRKLLVGGGLAVAALGVAAIVLKTLR